MNYQNYKPFHFPQAAEKLQSVYEENLQQLEEQITKEATTSTNSSSTEILGKIEELTFPIDTFQNILVLYKCMEDNHNLDPTWGDALSEASGIIDLKHETSIIIHDALLLWKQCQEEKHDDNTTPTCSIHNTLLHTKQELRIVKNILRQQRMHGLFITSSSSSSCNPTNANANENENDINDTKELILKLNQRISSLETEFYTMSSYTMEQHGKTTPTQKLLPYMYEILSLKKHRSIMLGYDDYLSYCLDYHSCMARKKEDIQLLHDSFVKEGVIEKYNSAGTDDFWMEYDDLLRSRSLRSSLSSSSSSSPISYKDYFEFNHVLDEMFSLCSMLFDITIQEEKDSTNINAWNKDVRLFHIYDNNDEEQQQRISSFYIDPFRRLNKEQSEFMTPILYRSKKLGTKPVCVVSLNIRPPMWDDSPVQLELYDVVHLFHEFGHLLQSSLVNVDMGSFSGTQTVEEDASEVVSQVCRLYFYHVLFVWDEYVFLCVY